MFPQQSFCRERRNWSDEEDALLREAVQREDPDNPNPSKWHDIAKHVPDRSNRCCRKRWLVKMASTAVKGGWDPGEDEQLLKGIERYGTRWTLVASVVQTRIGDQCAKRWTDTLNPSIVRTPWTSAADTLLLKAVSEYGRAWTTIAKKYFPGRTGLSAKNRYHSITRLEHNEYDHSDASLSQRKSFKEDKYHLVRPKSKGDSLLSRSLETLSIPIPNSSLSFVPPNTNSLKVPSSAISSIWSSSFPEMSN